MLRSLGDSSAACVTTMLDYYGLPKDFPGKAGLSGKSAGCSPGASARRRHQQSALSALPGVARVLDHAIC